MTMHSERRWLRMTSLLFVGILFAGCTASKPAADNKQAAAPAPAANAAPAEKPKYTVGILVNSAEHPYVKAMYDSMRSECDVARLECIFTDARYDAAKQSQLADDLIARKVNIILGFPADPKAFHAVLARIKDAGIPTVNYNTQVADSDLSLVTTFTGPSNEQEGQEAARLMNEALQGKGNIVIIEGQKGGYTQIQRTDGFTKELPPGIKVLGVQPADWNRGKALQVMQDFLTRFPNIDGVYAHDDDMAQGALQAIKVKGLEGKIKVVGIGGSCEGFKAVEAGTMYGTVLQSPVMDGAAAVRTAVDVLMGRNVSKQQFIPTPRVTKANMAQFKCEW